MFFTIITGVATHSLPHMRNGPSSFVTPKKLFCCLTSEGDTVWWVQQSHWQGSQMYNLQRQIYFSEFTEQYI